MSLVGTRPILPDELEQYELHHRARIAIKPGITGMWQVSGRSDITDFEEIVRLDTEYISEWNIGLDPTDDICTKTHFELVNVNNSNENSLLIDCDYFKTEMVNIGYILTTSIKFKKCCSAGKYVFD